jgi:hypothetical protein
MPELALAGLGREERTTVEARGDEGEGRVAAPSLPSSLHYWHPRRGTTLTLVAARLDLSREERAR